MLNGTLNTYIVIYLFFERLSITSFIFIYLVINVVCMLYFFLPIPSLLPRFSHSTEQRNSLLHPIPLSHSILGLCRPNIYGTLIHAVFYGLYCTAIYRSHWPCDLRRRSVSTRPLGLWDQIPPGAWLFVCCDCCVLSGRYLCNKLITRPEGSYRLWYVVVCYLETS